MYDLSCSPLALVTRRLPGSRRQTVRRKGIDSCGRASGRASRHRVRRRGGRRRRAGRRRVRRCGRLERHTASCRVSSAANQTLVMWEGRLTSVMASRTSLKTAGSTGWLKSMPVTSAPNVGASFLTSMCWNTGSVACGMMDTSAGSINTLCIGRLGVED